MSAFFQLYLEIIGIYLILIWAVYIPFRGGLLYNGCFYCMAIGAYAAGYISTNLGYPTGVALLFALVIGTAAGFLTAIAFSRTSGLVTATASMALIFILYSIIINLDFIGGAGGLIGIPKMPGLLPIIAISVVICGLIIFRIEHSRFGRALEAMRTDPQLASSLGINISKINIFVMTLSSAMGSLAGVFYSFTINAIVPDSFGFSLLLTTNAMMFLGGRYTMWGSLIAAPAIWSLKQWLPSSLSIYTNIIYGTLLILILILRPEGIIDRPMLRRLNDLTRSWWRRLKRSDSVTGNV